MLAKPQLISKAELAKCCADGLTVMDIAMKYGSEYDWVRTALRAFGLKANPESVYNCRRLIHGLSPEKAIETLLEVIAEQRRAMPATETLIDSWGIKWSRLHREFLTFLIDASPRLVSRDAIYTHLYGHRVARSQPTPAAVRTTLNHIRQKLKPEHGTIETVRGRGVRFVHGGSNDRT